MQREALLTKAAMPITQLINAGETIRISHRFSLVAAPSALVCELVSLYFFWLFSCALQYNRRLPKGQNKHV